MPSPLSRGRGDRRILRLHRAQSTSSSRARTEAAYRLQASLLIEHSSVPALRVGVNGRMGRFYLHPRLDYNMGDIVAAFYPAYARAEVEVEFPGSWLKAGTKSISFQAVPAGDKMVPDAGFEYDAIELQQEDAVPTAISASAEPTIFFQKHGGSINERVDVFVRYGERLRSGRVELRKGAETLALIKGNHARSIGRSRIIPEIITTLPAQMTT